MALAATDDRTLFFRLKKPFPLLPDALGKTSSMIAPIMPARLADGDPNRQITEIVGSGSYRFKADERLAGDRTVYERFADYRPNTNGPREYTAGAKVAHFDRIEWKIMPDSSTATAAIRTGQIGWWGDAIARPCCRCCGVRRGFRSRSWIRTARSRPSGSTTCIRPSATRRSAAPCSARSTSGTWRRQDPARRRVPARLP